MWLGWGSSTGPENEDRDGENQVNVCDITSPLFNRTDEKKNSVDFQRQAQSRSSPTTRAEAASVGRLEELGVRGRSRLLPSLTQGIQII